MFEKSARLLVVASGKILQKIALLLVFGYRLLLGGFFVGRCRFSPTCSAYALQALQVHGGFKGTWLVLKRLVRCNPFCHGGVDEVPAITKH